MSTPVRSRRRRWPIVAAAITIILGASGWMLWQRIERDDAEVLARYEAYRNQRDYQSRTLPCTLRFTRGGVDQVTAYVRQDWKGSAPELAEGSDDSEGETWAEFYSRDDLIDTAALDTLLASERHPLVGQRLVYLYADAIGVGVSFDGQLQPLYQGEDEGWRLRIRWLATPYAPVRVSPPDPAQPPVPLPTHWSDLSSESTIEARTEAIPRPWTWNAVEDAAPAIRNAFDHERRRSTDYMRDKPDDYRRVLERWDRIHTHFYLVEALRLISPGKALVLRRFGRVLGADTINRAVGEIGVMMRSLRCEPPID